MDWDCCFNIHAFDMFRPYFKRCKRELRACPEARELRQKRPNFVPVGIYILATSHAFIHLIIYYILICDLMQVIVEKHGRSDIPDIELVKLVSNSLLL